MSRLNYVGADLIIGHHPHVCHPIYSTGRSIFASSLGNFIFDQYHSKKTRKGNLLLVDFEQHDLLTEVVDIYIPRTLPVTITNTRIVSVTIQPAIKSFPEKMHQLMASIMTQVYRILSRIDLVLHLFPNTEEKIRCMTHWSSRKNP
jgi:poly-gamma-glutamate capsule biosynthesis protein CapA/YwtB (metallophosphatase superfamily)